MSEYKHLTDEEMYQLRMIHGEYNKMEAIAAVDTLAAALESAREELATVTDERDEARGEVARLVRESGIVQDSLHEAARDFRDERDTARAALEESRTDRDVFRGATNAALLDLADAEARIGELEERVAADSTAAILGASCAEIRDALTAPAAGDEGEGHRHCPKCSTRMHRLITKEVVCPTCGYDGPDYPVSVVGPAQPTAGGEVCGEGGFDVGVWGDECDDCGTDNATVKCQDCKPGQPTGWSPAKPGGEGGSDE